MVATRELRQGVDATIDVAGVLDADDAPLDLTGWTIHAQARPSARSSVLYAEWHSTPTGTQGTATADASGVHLTVSAAMSAAWTFRTALLHVEAVELVPPNRTARVGELRLVLNPEVVRPTTP